MKRSTIFTIVVLLATVFILDPFGLFKMRCGPVTPPLVSKDALLPLADLVRNDSRDPIGYIVSSFGSHDIVFLGEIPLIAQNPKLVADLIPRLYAAGVKSLGTEYALAEDQARIDALLTGSAYNEAEARAISLHWVFFWGFQEYIDIYRAAWTFNHGLPAGSTPFRIVGLNVRMNWEHVKTQGDMNDAEIMAKVRSNGVPDAVIADVILRRFVDKGEKALIYCEMACAFTAFRDAQYEKAAKEQNFTEIRKSGNIVYDRIGARAFTILLHAPWLNTQSQNGYAYPADGVIDAVIAALPADKKSAGFDTAGNAIGALAVHSLPYTVDITPHTLGDMCNGYVIMGPISGYAAVTPIKDFVSTADEEYISKNYPGPKTGDLTASNLNAQIAKAANDTAQMIIGFK
jgi:hypothetical protein